MIGGLLVTKVWCGIAFNVGGGGWCGIAFNVGGQPYGCNSLHFLKQIFGYTALHFSVDRLNLQLSTCIVCLCSLYHTCRLGRHSGSQLDKLRGPNSHEVPPWLAQRRNFEDFASLNCRKWHFQSLLYLFC